MDVNADQCEWLRQRSIGFQKIYVWTAVPSTLRCAGIQPLDAIPVGAGSARGAWSRKPLVAGTLTSGLGEAYARILTSGPPSAPVRLFFLILIF